MGGDDPSALFRSLVVAVLAIDGSASMLDCPVGRAVTLVPRRATDELGAPDEARWVGITGAAPSTSRGRTG